MKPKEYLIPNPEFVAKMNTEKKWPKYRDLFNYKRGEAVKEGSEKEYRKLRDGKRCCYSICPVLVRFLREKWGWTTEEADVGQFTTEPDEGEIDYTRFYDVARLLSIFMPYKRPAACSKLQCDSDFLETSRILMAAKGRHFSSSSKVSTLDEHIQYGEQLLDMTVEEFAKQLKKWASVNDQTVLLARERVESILGMTVIIPLDDGGYEQIKTGQKNEFELLPEQIKRYSNNLLLQSLAELHDMGGEPSRLLMRTFFYQMAVLADLKNCRFITFAGTPLNEKRLKSHGFWYVLNKSGEKVCTPKYGYPIMELKKNFRRPKSLTIYMGIITGLSVFQYSLYRSKKKLADD